MNLDQIHRVYFIGIGGIGMSSLARWFSQRGIAVAGYDKTETILTKRLVSEGMDIHYEDDLNLVPKVVLEDKAHSVIVFTPAVPKTHKELTFFQSGEYKLMKRFRDVGHHLQESLDCGRRRYAWQDHDLKYDRSYSP